MTSVTQLSHPILILQISFLMPRRIVETKVPKWRDIPCFLDWQCRKLDYDFCLDKKCYKKKDHAEECVKTTQCPRGTVCRRIETDTNKGVCSCKSDDKWINETCIDKNACFTDNDCTFGSCQEGWCNSNYLRGLFKGIIAVTTVCAFIGIIVWFVRFMQRKNQKSESPKSLVNNEFNSQGSSSGFGSTTVVVQNHGCNDISSKCPLHHQDEVPPATSSTTIPVVIRTSSHRDERVIKKHTDSSPDSVFAGDLH